MADTCVAQGAQEGSRHLGLEKTAHLRCMPFLPTSFTQMSAIVIKWLITVLRNECRKVADIWDREKATIMIKNHNISDRKAKKKRR